MINNVVSVPQVPDVASIKSVPDVPQALPQAQGSGASKNPTDTGAQTRDHSDKQLAYQLKLVVDVDPDSGDFIYKAIDRVTGQVISQLPRKELLDLKYDANYKAGSVIKTDI